MFKHMATFALATVFLAACGGAGENRYDAGAEASQVVAAFGRTAEEAATRAQLAKALAYAFYSQAEIVGLPHAVSYADVPEQSWYFPYINALQHAASQAGGEIEPEGQALFRPNEPITLAEAQAWLDATHPDNRVTLSIDDINAGMHVSNALLNELFGRFISQPGGVGTTSLLEHAGISEELHIILATPATNAQLPPWGSVSDAGAISHTGIVLDGYLDKQVRALMREGELLAVLGVEDESPTLVNALVLGGEAQGIRVFSGGVERVFSAQVPLPGVTIADVTISRGSITSLEPRLQSVRDGVLRRTSAEIELRQSGTRGIAPFGEFVAYSLAEGVAALRSVANITVGLDNVDFFIRDDGIITGAIINEAPSPERIRVAISTTGFEGLLHPQVVLASHSGASLSNGQSFAPGEEFEITQEMFGEASRIVVSPAQPDATIELRSVTRHGGAVMAYRGVLEVARVEGGFHIVNELGMREYLWGVVPSEMPSAFGEEAARVQAITARSYAVAQLFTNRFAAYGANVVDSVQSQVYNNISETPVAIAAVNYTEGRVLVYAGEPISANYFSASSGHTANSGEVWARGGQFPTYTPSFLRSFPQHDGDALDMHQESVAREFLTDWDIRALDMNSPFFRWQTELTAEEIRASIDANLAGRQEANPALILTLQESGEYSSVPIDTIGDLLDIEITARGEGGNIMEMRLTGTQATVRVKTEFNIRSIIQARQFIPGGRGIVINRLDGSTTTNQGIMPSAFYVIDRMTREDGTISSVRFHGGGSGHGVGMSHEGVRAMTQAGASFEDILLHYYPGAEISHIAFNFS